MTLKNIFPIFICFMSVVFADSLDNKTTSAERWKANDCGKPLYEVPKVQTCVAAFHANAFKRTCKSFPSPPQRLKYSFMFQKDSKTLNLTITWDKPEYGENTLWGYDVILRDSFHNMERCYQINGKGKLNRNFTFERVKFDRNYFVIVSSLPRKDRRMSNSIEVLIKSPDICKFFQDKETDLPFSCAKLEQLKMIKTCNESENAVISWKEPQIHYEEIFAEIHSSCSFDVKDTYLKKNICMMSLDKVQNGCRYSIQMHMVLSHKNGWEFSRGSDITFDCIVTKHQELNINETNWLIERSQKKAFSSYKDVILYSSISTLVLAFFLFLIYWRQKRSTFLQWRKFAGERLTSISEELQKDKNNDNEVPSVMILHAAGCKYLQELVLIIASIFNSNGIKVRLDLLEKTNIAQMGAASYYETVEKESDYVIIICSNVIVLNSSCSNSFNFVVDIIKHNMMNKRDRSKYIPAYCDDLSSVSVSLRGIAQKIPDDLENIIERLLHVQSYVVSKNETLPMKNEIMLGEQSTSLNLCVRNLLRRAHPNCAISHCSKGTTSLQSEENLANSFEDILNYS